MPTTLLLPPTALDVTREKKMHSAAAAAKAGRTSTRLAYLQPIVGSNRRRYSKVNNLEKEAR